MVLRIGTGATSAAHHAQECVGFPNLFLSDPVQLACIDSDGREVMVETLVYRALIPHCVCLGRDEGDQLMSVRLRDYPLLYSGNRQTLYEQDPRRHRVLQDLLAIRSEFGARGLWRLSRVRECIVEAFPIRQWLERFVRDQRRVMDDLGDLYDLPRLERELASGRFPP
jgi:hypothetical protein